MERVYAFTDESGAFGWLLDNSSVSTHFIIGAIIVRESNLEGVREQVEEVRRRHFQTGEMKSSSIGKNHARRKRILADLLRIDFSVFAVVIDKSQLNSSQLTFDESSPNEQHLRSTVTHFTVLHGGRGGAFFISGTYSHRACSVFKGDWGHCHQQADCKSP
ncbi:MAG: hypothetical protein PHI98_10740 [Eubacteriales bacterium]|nr:hypothetical protein [Eubacteriales bacterium]